LVTLIPVGNQPNDIVIKAFQVGAKWALESTVRLGASRWSSSSSGLFIGLDSRWQVWRGHAASVCGWELYVCHTAHTHTCNLVQCVFSTKDWANSSLILKDCGNTSAESRSRNIFCCWQPAGPHISSYLPISCGFF